MKQADFYILPCSDDDGKTEFLCKLLARICGDAHQVFLYCDDEFSMQRISELLWNYKDTSFLANKTANEELKASITIGYDTAHLPSHRDVLVNFSNTIPDEAEHFERVVEIVIQQPQVLTRSRERYKSYRAQGFNIKHNDMRPTQQPNNQVSH